MAIYHLEAKVISRSVGRSAVAAAAYMSCSRFSTIMTVCSTIIRESTGLYMNKCCCRRKLRRNGKTEACYGTPLKKRKKQRTADSHGNLLLALPVELSREQNISLIAEYVSENFVADGMCADFCIHDTDGHNPHAHIMLTVRPLENGKWQSKTEKEYLCVKNGEEKGFTSAEFRRHRLTAGKTDTSNSVGKKKVYMPPSQAEGLERVSKYPKSTRYGRQNPITERWNSESSCRYGEKIGLVFQINILNLQNPKAVSTTEVIRQGALMSSRQFMRTFPARIIEKKGGVSERCELNRQIKEDNRILREIKKRIKKADGGSQAHSACRCGKKAVSKNYAVQ